ncbi:unnamed protein product [Cuscuta europaea]|uniref:Uncharacterized protein n=1 Tax=Cuscuta europaea TaxID=41803 RepID=A0A9P1DY70_CUSEU|nr:unnamed protein product [Cuscuta europaea]
MESNPEGINSMDEEGEGLMRSNNVEVDPDILVTQVMQSKMSGCPKLLPKWASGSRIFRAPSELLGTDSEADARPYQPRTFSIGPYHHGKPHLKEMQEHKLRFLERVVKRTEEKGVGLEEYVKAVRRLEEEARDMYSEVINLSSDEFVEMLVLDGCFVLVILQPRSWDLVLNEDLPLCSIAHFIYDNCYQDLFCLENQMPYTVLHTLFTLTETDSDADIDTKPRLARLDSLANIALEFFEFDPEKLEDLFGPDFKILHLLHLFRKGYSLHPANLHLVLAPTRTSSCLWRTPSTVKDCGTIEEGLMKKNGIQSISKMPLLWFNDTMCDFLLNCVAFEICYPDAGRYMSDYAQFLHCLIHTQEDVDILCEAKVLRINYGKAGEVAAFVGKLGMALQSKKRGFFGSYLGEVYAGVNNYYHNDLHIYLAEVNHKYFSSPWTLISLLAAIFLLLLTVLQTIVAILDLEKKN